MLHELPVFAGCIEDMGNGTYSFHIHHSVTGIPGEVVLSSSEFYETRELAHINMKKEMRDICFYMSMRSRELLIDPSKFVDVDEVSVSNYGRENLH